MKFYTFLLFALIAIALSSCITKTEFRRIHDIETSQKLPENVELLFCKPRRDIVCIGLIGTNGNGYASYEDGVRAAKKRAAIAGADFILLEESGVETSQHFNPGYSTYQSNGSAYVSGNNRSIYGSASQRATGYSVGPSVTTINCPWAVFSAWVYRPSATGIYVDNVDNELVVSGFKLHSNAEEMGLRIGDKVLGIDGIDIMDNRLQRHLMSILPGEDMIFTISRDGKKIDISIKALEN